MSFPGSAKTRKDNAVSWFACAAAAITVTAAVGAYGLSWIVRTEHAQRSAFLPLDRPAGSPQAFGEPDTNATGSIDGVSKIPSVR